MAGASPPASRPAAQPKDNYVLGGSVGSSSPVASAINAPETASYSGGNYLRVQQATWTSTVSNKLLIEAGFGTYMNHWGGVEIPGNPTRDIVRVVEQCSAGCAANGGIPGLTYRSQNWAINIQKAFNWKASASYVTGRHSLKVGYQASFNYTNGHPCHQQPEPAVSRQQRDSKPAHAEHVRVLHHEEPGPDDRSVRPGAMDRWPAHPSGRGAIRPRQQLFSRSRRIAANRFLHARRRGSPDGRRHRLQRPDASRRRGLGSVRRRQDGGQDQRGPVPAERRRRRALYGHQSAWRHPGQRHPHRGRTPTTISRQTAT